MTLITLKKAFQLLLCNDNEEFIKLFFHLLRGPLSSWCASR